MKPNFKTPLSGIIPPLVTPLVINNIAMKPNFKTPLSGIIPPLVTPLVDNETLDVESLERLIEHLIAGGVHGLFVLGTTGEEQSLSYDVRKQMIKESCRINRGRLPLLGPALRIHR